MNWGKYLPPPVLTLCGLLLSFLGFLGFFLLPRSEFSSVVLLLVIVLLTVTMSYINKTPLGGSFLGVYTSVSAFLGFFLMTCVWYMIKQGTDQGFAQALTELASRGLSILSAVSAIASIAS